MTCKDFAAWLGRTVRTASGQAVDNNKRGTVPTHLLPVFARLQLQERNRVAAWPNPAAMAALDDQVLCRYQWLISSDRFDRSIAEAWCK